MADEYDLKIVGGDLAFGPDDEPLFLADADAIAQDVKHRVEASGLTVELVGDEDSPDATLRRVAFEVEEDERIQPGSAEVTRGAPGKITVKAKTIAGETITA